MYSLDVNNVLAKNLTSLRAIHRAFKKTTFISPTSGKKQELVHIGANDTVYMSLWGWLVRRGRCHSPVLRVTHFRMSLIVMPCPDGFLLIECFLICTVRSSLKRRA